ncbi:heme ABC exporter ATP-binding protein CcmA [Paracoccus sphaerophysae]|uniref:Cytochrome C biogenesis protein CcmA n=1 Tax=Paracoccus sphaerophysae TaxID=690417 RepID=A0A099F1X8_9RHOB|nr:heme ABC exporter ATP-binding protein CcmA [Paracoccus sphaerophysae]KGJ04690.1 cytochrome C biogenesis protein CcmA [Paracoccus sphaerophysae]
MALISVRGLAVSRGGRRAVEGVDFDLAAGEALILRGPNGIGKTTLLRTVAGLQPATEGSIQADPDAIAYAAHADGLKGALSVAENLRFWREVFGGPAIDRAVAAMNLSDLVSRPAAMLSAGQKRRLGLARLLVTGRPVWVLDEPTVSLDAGSVALFADAVRAHLAQGGAALMATHIELGLPEARVLDLGPFCADARRPAARAPASFDEAFG